MYLNCHTYYSIGYGTMDISSLLELAKQNGCDSFVLTDINSVTSCIDFVRLAEKSAIKPIVGVDFRNGARQQFVAIAKNNQGFLEINQFLSSLLHEHQDVPDRAPAFQDAFVIYPFSKNTEYSLQENEYIGLKLSDLPFVSYANFPTEKCVILQTVTFRTKKDFNAHRLLRAISLNCLLSKLPADEQGDEGQKMIPISELIAQFSEFPEVIKNTELILNQSSIFFDFSPTRAENLQTYTGSAEKDYKLLKKLCSEGLDYRYPTMNETIKERIKKELKAIKKMNFVSYFLINWDIVSYAQSKGYFYVGRGSGANSVIAYLLKITNVDPIELDLYFERFINAFRSSPPDFDIDFSWTDRDDVTRYIFERFEHVALVATYNTFKKRSVIRELGKVFGLPKEEIDKLVRPTGAKADENQLASLVLKYGDYIRGFPSHLSIHACGIVISQRPINYFTATFMPPKGYPTIQFDMHASEDMGWYKFDILSQRGLSKIKDSLEIIAMNQPEIEAIDINDIPKFKEDERIKDMLRKADAIGCFYVESPAMRMLLRKLQVDNYLGLVAASSVIRPGVAQSGMMQEYIKRYRNPERRKDANEALLDLMPDTFGVMVYQEDVIKVAHYFAGLSLDEADKMRRGMSGKFRSREEFNAVREKFFETSILVKGNDPELTAEVWRQTESFAGYAFAKGHSASYAVESYQCLFLKAYFPLEFMVATINNYGGFYSTELYVLEAKRLGGQIESCCINRSFVSTCIYGTTIFLGFHLLASFERKVAKRIVKERNLDGDFLDIDDFLERVPISIEQMNILIRANAFRFTGKGKRSLLWEAQLKIQPKKEWVPELFRLKPVSFEIPELHEIWQEDAFDQLELFDFSLYDPFLLANQDARTVIKAKDLHRFAGQKVWIKGYLIHVKKTMTNRGEQMFFGTFIDEEGDWLDSVHFPDIARRFQFRGRGVYLVFGKVNLEYDCIIIEAEYLEKLGMLEDPRYSLGLGV